MKKVFVFLPDGVGLRNFVFGDFYEIGKQKNIDIIYWNNTDFPIHENYIRVKQGKSNWLADLFKRSRSKIELKQSYKKFKDEAYLSYSFTQSFKTIKTAIKSSLVSMFSMLFNSELGLKKVRSYIEKFERNSEYYFNVKKQLQNEAPNFVFSTNQRPLKAIAPILAAKDLGIPTATFIFSWDNLPKGMLVLETDYYYVWSTYMKKELLKYYPFILEEQIKITGTPQFEPHFNKKLIIDKNVFFKKNNLDLNKKYICFSGDDITTSPNDQLYLEDVVKAIKSLNSKGFNLGLIYRKCPVDFSNRHMSIYNEYKDIMVLVDPLWENLGNGWNRVMPTENDTSLLVNTIKNTEMVINVGSSMVFDYVCHNKPCAFLNYNTDKSVDKNWNIEKIYKYIHFKSMPSKDAVLWINSKNKIEEVILKGLEMKNLSSTKEWFKTIAGEEPTKASNRIWESIAKVVN
ncbi:hypothetical protein SAMN05444411_102338 [Lutibacter oricola]|uniref:UDP-N-acetylglucosamine:LPS N-acetylglucosamine transferase n=1 Tax=Lutibacter oricola TaxID=762486 RepID=A0A1H2X2I7_9FLAO|nr:UDP-glycosyltransferase [Lutibacter oricola]SDW86479.1 hypothetical protein SAMN05444411_102338 [Lutibacter oricola]